MRLLVSLLAAFALKMPTMEVKDGTSPPMKSVINHGPPSLRGDGPSQDLATLPHDTSLRERLVQP